MIIDLLTLLAAAYAVYLCLDLQRKVWRMDSRVTALENQKPAKSEPKALERVQARQVFEKPIVKNAKEVKPLEIGDGRMRFDEEAQIAEWI